MSEMALVSEVTSPLILEMPAQRRFIFLIESLVFWVLGHSLMLICEATSAAVVASIETFRLHLII